MSVEATFSFRASFEEQTSNDLGTAQQRHLFEFPGSLNPGGVYLTGTTDNKADQVWSDTRTLAAAADSLDLRGGLTAAIGGAALAFIEVRGIFIRNKATAAANILLVGAGSNPAFAGLFGATGDILKVPASGCFLWIAPLDTGGLTTTAGTADILYIDAGANTVSYDIVIWGVSA